MTNAGLTLLGYFLSLSIFEKAHFMSFNPHRGLNYIVMAKVKLTQVKSTIDRPERQRLTLEALGLRKINASVEHEDTPQIKGMIEKVKHLLKVEYA